MTPMQTLIEQLRLEGIAHQTDVPMAPYTTFRIGGPAKLLIEPKSEQEMLLCLEQVAARELSCFVLGRGSNVLVADEGVDAVVIRTCGLRQISCRDQAITAEAGATLFDVCRQALAAELGGMEFAYGIPGTLGGALCMNAGAYGGEMKDVVSAVRVYDARTGQILTLDREQMEFDYRHSTLLSAPYLTALSATLSLSKQDAQVIRERMQDYMARRQQKQPLELPSAGSTFRRPAGHFAGELIEQSGLKGTRIGDAMVSPKHAGFIVNVGNATAQDVLRLIDHIQKTVWKDHGVALECEVQILTRFMAR